jgi:hypothetical protein
MGDCLTTLMHYQLTDSQYLKSNIVLEKMMFELAEKTKEKNYRYSALSALPVLHPPHRP